MAVALSVIQSADAAPLVIDIALDISGFPTIELADVYKRQHMGRSGRDDVARVGDVPRGLEEKKGGRDAPRAVRPFCYGIWRLLQRKARGFC